MTDVPPERSACGLVRPGWGAMRAAAALLIGFGLGTVLRRDTTTNTSPLTSTVHTRGQLSHASPAPVTLYPSSTVEPARVGCVRATEDVRWAIAPWNASWVENPAPWVKDDFSVPICARCGCSDPSDTSTRSFRLSDLWSVLTRHGVWRDAGGRADAFVVNVGAADGAGGVSDPTYEVVMEPGVSSLLIDGQTGDPLFEAYKANPRAVIRSGVQIDAATLVPLLQSEGVPRRFGLLKVDIDSWECAILRRLTDAGFTPLIIHVEINTSFPPPLRFSVEPLRAVDTAAFVPPVWQLTSAFFGCSLSAIADILLPAGYHVLETDGWDTTFLHADVAALFEPLPRTHAGAWKNGFARQYAQRPACMDVLPKVNDQAIAPTVAAVLQRIQGHGLHDQEARAGLEALRAQLTAMAPMSADGAFPFSLDVQGPADGIEEQRSRECA